MTANEIRDSFKKFFESKGHQIVPSAPMVVKADPTLMFTNAGMNQWKDIILGTRDPEPRRRADSQKCLRVSGKHNDLEEVGHDTYHHTMFEMLGNWSFGDYFKEGAIDMAWEYLVDVLKLDPKDLYVTVFEGSAEENLVRDDEAAGYWLKHVPADHIINGNKHDNFWEMGDTGPCGPCSEIHLDSRTPEEKAKVPGRELVNKDDPQVIEIWNIVFMQYERKADGHLEPLGMNVIDTGMGFERLVRAIQGKHSNYDTDVFQPIIKAIGDLSGYKYGDKEETDVAMRVIADHLRTIAFSIADGQLPGNAKAGYVIRRILRRAVRYGYTFLGFKQPFINELVDTLVNQMGNQYTELKKQHELIRRIILEEEQSFLKTLANGISRFEDYVGSHAGSKTIDGAFAFELFDTYGFPVDLTQLMASEKGWNVDMEGFQKGLEQQKERSRAAAQVENDDWVELTDASTSAQQEFVGYDTMQCEVHITRYRHVKVKDKEFFQLVFDRTPFYGESGGQVGDQGTLTHPAGDVVTVVNTKKENNLIIHIVNKLPEHLNDTYNAEVDKCRRFAIECNHSATHLLHKALRSVLGEHVEQKGSSVDEQRLRFDFSHFAKLSHDEIREVEKQVNIAIRRALPLEEHRAMPIAEARNLGAMALFGEKYGEFVRVVKFGDSVEFCGGTHTSNTGHIGSFRIVSEGAVAAGMRRIEAVTGAAAEKFNDALQDQLDTLREMCKNPKDIVAAVQRLQDENAALRSQIDQFQKQQIDALRRSLAEQLQQNPVIVRRTADDLGQLKDAMLALRTQFPDMAIVLGSTFGDKPSLLVALGQNRVDAGKNAGTIVRTAGKEMQGGGGGQPGYATAGGKNIEGLDKAIAVAAEMI